MNDFWKIQKNDSSEILTEIKTVNKVVQFLFANSSEWIIHHNYNCSNIVVQCFDDSGLLFLYDDIEIYSDTIIIKLSDEKSGFANVLFVGANIDAI
jgi:hypothetical protein